mmetsp:Transcript_27794/g.41136  ORF Transcript_27794/g.41136 Transcript_27794/m.41136 type:complete len:95 (-) Transcript_27794:1001-1285(-)
MGEKLGLLLSKVYFSLTSLKTSQIGKSQTLFGEKSGVSCAMLLHSIFISISLANISIIHNICCFYSMIRCVWKHLFLLARVKNQSRLEPRITNF